MTIGPEPMMRIEWMSVRFGIRTPASISSANISNRYLAVVRARPGLRVVLHAERRHTAHPHALVGLVVEVEVGHLDLAVEARRVDAEVVVLAGDLDVAGRLVAHRMVAAVVAERQLERVAAERPAEQLMAEADAEDRHLAEQLGDGVDRVADHRRVARAVRQEHAVGLACQHLGRGRRGRHDLDRAEAGEVAQDRALDAEVEGDDRAAWRRCRRVYGAAAW